MFRLPFHEPWLWNDVSNFDGVVKCLTRSFTSRGSGMMSPTLPLLIYWSRTIFWIQIRRGWYILCGIAALCVFSRWYLYKLYI